MDYSTCIIAHVLHSMTCIIVMHCTKCIIAQMHCTTYIIVQVLHCITRIIAQFMHHTMCCTLHKCIVHRASNHNLCTVLYAPFRIICSVPQVLYCTTYQPLCHLLYSRRLYCIVHTINYITKRNKLCYISCRLTYKMYICIIIYVILCNIIYRTKH